MANKDIVVIGASYGGIEALKVLVSGLPEGFHASVFLVQHRRSTAPGLLPLILMKAGPLPASFPADFEPIERGHIYVAPPDYHMMLERGLVRLTRDPKENHVRPAIDALFRSAAYAYGPRVVGVVLTGLLNDGTAGLWVVKDRGGTAIVQDPKGAIAPSMPQSALQNVAVDYCLPLGEIAPLLAQLAHGGVKGKEIDRAGRIEDRGGDCQGKFGTMRLCPLPICAYCAQLAVRPRLEKRLLVEWPRRSEENEARSWTSRVRRGTKSLPGFAFGVPPQPSATTCNSPTSRQSKLQWPLCTVVIVRLRTSSLSRGLVSLQSVKQRLIATNATIIV